MDPQPGLADSEILSRLENVLDGKPQTPETSENTQETKPDPITAPAAEQDPPPQKEEGDEPTAISAKEEPAEGEAEKSESEIAAASDGDADAVNTISDLAKMFEVEEKELLDNLQIDTGDGKSVPLSQVISSYKDSPEATRKLADIQAREVAFEAESSQLRIKTDDHIRELALHAQTLLDMTNEEFKDIDWKVLEEQDPQRFLIMKEKQRERGRAIQGAIEQMKKVDTNRSEQMVTAANTHRASEMVKLHTKMPAWTDESVAKAAMTETSQFLSEAGFSQEEINAITDHRYLLVAYDAAQYRKLKTQAPGKLEKLRGLPKPKAVLRSTARRDTSQDAQQNAQKNFDRLKKTGEPEDAARLFEELL